jgi:putative MATE family efflux protein
VAALCNIILNFLLVFHTPLGYRGIALSTALSVFLGCLLNYLHLTPVLRQKKDFSRESVKRIAVIAWPAVLLRGAWQLGSTVLFLIIGSLPFQSVETLAAFTNGLRIESAVFLPAFAFNMANAVIVGNYLGHKKTDDAFRAGLITAFLSVVVIVMLTILVVLNAGRLSRFLSPDPVVIAESIRYIYISMISEPFMAWAVVLSGGLNGAGDTRSVMIIVVMSLWLVRIPLAYVLGITAGLGAPAIWWAMNASIFLHALFVTRRYLQRNWLYDE